MSELWHLVKDNKYLLNSYRLCEGEDKIDAIDNLIPDSHRESSEKGEWDEWGYNYKHRGSWYIVTQYVPQNAYHIYKKQRRTPTTKRKRTIEEVYTSPTYPATTNETLLREIADVAGLNSQTKRRFVQFGLLFWEGKRADPTYILEWARRFWRGSEYAVADNIRLEYLREVDGVEGARSRLFAAYIRGGSRPDVAEKNVMKVYPKARRVKRRTTTKRKVKR